ncbi:MAG: RNA polymerase sigma factor [Solitalea-like symbiont of Acarus siro]
MKETTYNNTSAKRKKDHSLVECALNGDQNAYTIIMRQYHYPIYCMILKIVQNKDDAHDLTMEAFTKAFCNLTKYEKKFAFSTWLYRIAANHSIDFIKKKKIVTISIYIRDDQNKSDDILEIEEANSLTPEDKYLRKEKNEFMRSIINKLPENYQNLIKLRYLSEYSYNEIAEELKLPLGTVKAKLMRAKKLLLSIFKRSGSTF